ncbi:MULTISPECIES: hypothetical protein [unclassified Beijerinckia]|uniref:hypothetical protein n=1 Tax=unclassified Beijerinckia TaxID=2638183 RepID=UPI00089BC688|nr:MULTISPECIES: hypothetical protein [unclassified Beijerinckia]MDH7796685.1 hypothetical protein [Beijerinckia sp. GAS462]SEC55655.1 hypothetical protein SAMN05443249_2969 [Beijerinckia sp. 28-YEA-48]
MMAMIPTPRAGWNPVLATLVAAGLMTAAAPAFAQSCNDDIAKFQERRQAQIGALNNLSKQGKGKLDPIAACPRLRNLVAIENQMFEYMTKNQSWCSIPDDVMGQVKDGKGKSANLAAQACKAAAMARKMQQQAREGGGAPGAPAAPKLPSGPL